MDRHKVTADQMGMLATLQNSRALGVLLEDASVRSQLFSAHGMVGTTRRYSIEEASKALKQGNVVLCAGGTGNPLFTTDSAARLICSTSKRHRTWRRGRLRELVK